METNWTKDELVAYVLLYAAHSDFKEDNHERNVIISKVDMQTFQKIHDEFDADNDYQSIQKIMAGMEAHNFSKEDSNILLAEIKALLFSDGEFTLNEQQLLRSLNNLLK
ncbi:hypothetical protein Q2T40_10810 [Winogradskyella maritima]|uniref:Tellurite resistance protein TerB n=1 Tax=Winogradskyella maritima TaxID=1517766 RepID=A0ABV8AM93_9FLAO|nr:hypothetical protein [Winogradskyella maritima]